MNILLVCSAGMSTSFVVKRMRAAAKEMKENHTIWALSIDEASEDFDKADVILIGPQIRYALDEIKAQSNKPTEVIDRTNYGLGKGKEVLEQAKNLYEGGNQ